jgi:adenylate cyclase
MGVEIERKFRVRHTDFLAGVTGQWLCQGYLSHQAEATVRVRLDEDGARLTLKGMTQGATRREFEYPIPPGDARIMLDEMCPAGRIEKTRYRIEAPPHVWEVDVFAGDNEGLVLAEIELSDEQESFERPDWLGEEVTHDPRYYNSELSRHPWPLWSDNPS